MRHQIEWITFKRGLFLIDAAMNQSLGLVTQINVIEQEHEDAVGLFFFKISIDCVFPSWMTRIFLLQFYNLYKGVGFSPSLVMLHGVRWLISMIGLAINVALVVVTIKNKYAAK